jgi:hypothetical protein
MKTCSVVRSSRPPGCFSFGLLNGLPIRLRRPPLPEAPAVFGLKGLALAFTNNSGYAPHVHSDMYRSSYGDAQPEVLPCIGRVCKDVIP